MTIFQENYFHLNRNAQQVPWLSFSFRDYEFTGKMRTILYFLFNFKAVISLIATFHVETKKLQKGRDQFMLDTSPSPGFDSRGFHYRFVILYHFGIWLFSFDYLSLAPHILESLQFRNSHHKTWFRKWVVKFDGYMLFSAIVKLRARSEIMFIKTAELSWPSPAICLVPWWVKNQLPARMEAIESWQWCFSWFHRTFPRKTSWPELCFQEMLLKYFISPYDSRSYGFPEILSSAFAFVPFRDKLLVLISDVWNLFISNVYYLSIYEIDHFIIRPPSDKHVRCFL